MFTSKQKVEKPLCINALTHLQNFHCERKLQQAVVAYITNSMMTKQNETKLKAIFLQFDKDGDGTLTDKELREGFLEFLGDSLIGETDFN